MRYGHQPLSEIERMSMDDLLMWAEEIVDIVSAENSTGRLDRAVED